MATVLPLVVLGVFAVALAAWLIRRGRARRARRMRSLEGLGFTPCPAEAEALAERIARHENNSEYRYRVAEPWRAELAGKPVYYYTKERSRQGDVTACEELLFALDRPSPEGLVLFFKPSALRHGTSTALLGNLATGGWDSQPDDLTRLEIPAELRESNLIGALAPAGASLQDLVSAKSLSALQPVGDLGALLVICRGGECSLAGASAGAPLRLDRLWPVVRQLATGS